MKTEYIVILLMFVQTAVYGATLFVIIRQNQKLQNIFMVNNYSRFLDMLKELRLLRIKDPSLAKIYEKDVEGLNDSEVKAHFFNLILLSIVELIFYTKKQNLLDAKTFEFWKHSIKNFMQEESFQAMLERPSYKIVSPEILDLIKEIEKESKINKKNMGSHGKK